MGNILDELPLGVLLALQEAVGDPSEAGQARARARAADAGYHVELLGEAIRFLPMEDAPEGIEAIELRFDALPTQKG